MRIFSTISILLITAFFAVPHALSQGLKAQRFRGIQLIGPTTKNNTNEKNQGVALLAPPGVTTSYALIFPTSRGAVGQSLTINTLDGSSGAFLGWSTTLTAESGWMIGGNLLTDSTTSWLGTKASASADWPLVLQTDGNERMRILGGSGYVGIGTANPTAQLQINSANASTTSLMLRMVANTTANALEVQDNSRVLFSIGPTGAVSLRPFANAGGSTNELRFLEMDVNGSEYVGFKAPDLIATSRIWTLPAADGTNGQAMTTNGSGILGWTSILSPTTGWTLSGNGGASSTGALGATPTGARLGTTDAFDLRIVTNDRVRMLIASTGAVSVGSTFDATGLITGSAGAALTGATTINTTGTSLTTIGSTTASVTIGSVSGAVKSSVGANDRIVLANGSGTLDQASIASVVSAGIGGTAWLTAGNGSTSNGGTLGFAPTGNFIGTTGTATAARDLSFVTNNLIQAQVTTDGLFNARGLVARASGVNPAPNLIEAVNVNSRSVLTLDGSGTLTLRGSTSFGSPEFRMAGLANAVGFKINSPSVTTIYVLPDADGTNGQALTTNGSAVLGWTSVLTPTSGWQLAGNGTSDAWNGSTGARLGTTSAQPLVLATTNAVAQDIRFFTGSSGANERMRITGNGLVLIGTTSGTNTLEVGGTLRATGLITGTAGATISGAATSISGGTVAINENSNNTTNINTGTSTGAVNIGTGASSGTVTIGRTGGTLTTIGSLGHTGAAAITGATTINTTGTSATTIGSTTASVTIGSVSGAVKSSVGANDRIVLANGSGTLDQASIASVVAAGVAGNAWSLTGNDITEGTNFLGTTTAKRLELRTSNTERMRITSNGLVLIGTTSGTNTLEVGGTLRATGLITGTAGATISGGATSINDASNFNTNINTGGSTGTVTIGNASSTTTMLGATTINASGNGNTTIGNATTTGTTTIATNSTSGRLVISGLPTGTTDDVLLINGSNQVSRVTQANLFAGQGWGLTGNDITSSGGALGGAATGSFLGTRGTSTAKDLRIATNGNVRMIVASDGAITMGSTLGVTGLITGTAGATISGGATSISGGTVAINENSNNTTNINTGTSTGAVNIGTGASSGTVTIGRTGGTLTTIGSLGHTGAAALTGATTINTTGTSATTIGSTTASVTIGSVSGAVKSSVGANDRIVLANSSGTLDQASIASVVSAGIGGTAWLTAGNGTSDAWNGSTGARLGTTSAQPLVLATTNAVAQDIRFFTGNNGANERMRILGTGNIGIGLAAPTSALHVDRGNATASYLQFTAGTTTGQTSSDGFDVGIDGSGNAVLNQSESLSMLFSTANTERMRITSDGRVGVLETAPKSILQVSTPDNSAIGLIVKASNNISIGAPPPAGPGVPPGGANGNLFELRDGNDQILFFASYSGSLVMRPYGTTAGQTNEIRFRELVANGSNDVGFKAPDNLGSDVMWTLPNADGTNGQALTTNGSGTLGWSSVLTPTSGWQLAGNSTGDAWNGSTGTRLGTTSAQPLVLATTNAVAQDIRFFTGSNGANERMRITGAGSVLIGVTSGTNTLEVGGTVRATGLITGTAGATISGGATSINDASNFNTNINTGGSTGTVAIGNASSTTTMLGATTINATGNGNTTIGNATTTGTTTIATNSTSGRLVISGLPTGTTDDVLLINGSNQVSRVTQANLFAGQGWGLTGNDITSSGGALGGAATGSFLGTRGTSTAKDLRIATNGNVRMIVASDGAITIGSTLGVTGAITGSAGVNLSGLASPLQANGSAGTSGQVLTSAGAGNTPTWTNAQAAAGIKSKGRSALLASVTSTTISGIVNLDADDGISVTLEGDASGMPVPSFYVQRTTGASGTITVYFSSGYSGRITWLVID